MPSRSEGWGGLFNGEQYRLITNASWTFIRTLRDFEQTTPARACPSLLRRGMQPNRTYYHQYHAKRSSDLDLCLRTPPLRKVQRACYEPPACLGCRGGLRQFLHSV
jgi:hypothetical protein